MSPPPKAQKTDPTAASGPGVAYSYIRFSTRIQETGDSLHRQKTLADDYAAKHGLKLNSARFEDLGVSGFRDKHIEGGALGKFLLAVRQKKILPGSTLLVEAFDRLGRGKLTDQLKFVLEIVSHGIKVITISDGLVYDQASFDKDPSKYYSTLGFMWRGHEESSIKSFRIRESWRSKREAAVANGERMTKRGPAWLRATNDGKFEIIPERGEIIRRIFSLYLQKTGKAAIAKQLQREKVPIWTDPKKTKDGKKSNIRVWQPNYIIRIVSNPAVIGELHLGMRDEVTKKRAMTKQVLVGYYPAVIDRDTFDRAQLIRKGKLMPTGQAQSRGANLFTGLLHDGHAKGFLMRMQVKGRVSKYPRSSIYLVSDAERIDQVNTWNYVKFEESFFEFIDHVNWQSLVAQKETPVEVSKWEAHTTSIKAELKVLEKERDNLVEYIGKAGHSDSVQQRLQKKERDIDIRVQELVELQQKQAAARAAVEAIKAGKQVQKVVDIRDRETRLRLRNVICDQIEKIELYPHGAPDKWEMESLVHTSDWPGFKVTFRNGVWRWVFVDPKHPKKLITLAQESTEEEIEADIAEVMGDKEILAAALKQLPRHAKRVIKKVEKALGKTTAE